MKTMRNRKAGSPQAPNGVCCALIGSMTQALQVQSCLRRESITANVIKVNDAPGVRGCIYGITYPCQQENKLRGVLTKSHITVRQYMGEWDG